MVGIGFLLFVILFPMLSGTTFSEVSGKSQNPIPYPNSYSDTIDRQCTELFPPNTIPYLDRLDYLFENDIDNLGCFTLLSIDVISGETKILLNNDIARICISDGSVESMGVGIGFVSLPCKIGSEHWAQCRADNSFPVLSFIP